MINIMIQSRDCAPPFCFVVLPRRCPPSSTLFPYTTLFRSPHRGAGGGRGGAGAPGGARFHRGSPRGAGRGRPRDRRAARSEEHTSELQSRGHLVCRLLLEKKKKNQIVILDQFNQDYTTIAS